MRHRGQATNEGSSKRKPRSISRSTINPNISVLRAALARAVEWGTLSAMPLGKTRRRAEDENAIVRYLTEDEEGRLSAALLARDARRANPPTSGAAHRDGECPRQGTTVLRSGANKLCDLTSQMGKKRWIDWRAVGGLRVDYSNHLPPPEHRNNSFGSDIGKATLIRGIGVNVGSRVNPAATRHRADVTGREMHPITRTALGSLSRYSDSIVTIDSIDSDCI